MTLGIVLLGQSNSGKSTIGKAVADKMGMTYISSGDIARDMSKEITDVLNRGELAPENIMRERILVAINSVEGDFILDGFPRFEDQYEWLNQIVGEDVKFIYVIIDVSNDDIYHRAMRRGRCDDKSIVQKMEWFYTHTQPMIEQIIYSETVHNIKNGDHNDINENIDKLCKIVEECRC